MTQMAAPYDPTAPRGVIGCVTSWLTHLWQTPTQYRAEPLPPTEPDAPTEPSSTARVVRVAGAQVQRPLMLDEAGQVCADPTATAELTLVVDDAATAAAVELALQTGAAVRVVALAAS